MQYCTTCLFPAFAATPLTFDKAGRCSGCQAAELKKRIDWNKRKKLFVELLDEYRSGKNYDCVVPVSGGKDSYFAAHIAKEFDLKPLFVTYHGNNYLPEGEWNLQRMRDCFNADHIISRPPTDVLVKLNRLGFKLTGDMNWHCHCGIFTYPVRVAVQHKIPLILWGDHGFTEQGGMYSHNDFFEYTAKDRYEHALHGYDWYDFIEETEKLTPKDLLWAQYPSDKKISDIGVRGIFLSNYFPYDGNFHARLAAKQYGWQAAREPFDRTYRRISNLDDMHENGVHDYMKFIKLGYGRGTDHANYDIRLGLMSRRRGIEIVKKYDHVKPRDLHRWLAYVGMEEEEFEAIADTFRNPRVWSIENGEWYKDNVWGGSSSYGPVKSSPTFASSHTAEKQSS